MLWLLGATRPRRATCGARPRARGVAADRLVFAARVPAGQHLARHRLADLFLDTLPYNAHTTASDALWAGLPVLTCVGSTFPGRVAASLLHAVGLPSSSRAASRSTRRWRSISRARRGELAAIRATLARNRASCPLFDTERFRRHLEAAT